MNPRPTPDSFIAPLEALAQLFERHGRKRWGAWAREQLSRAKRGDRAIGDWVLSGFGGMGSLSDEQFCPENTPGLARQAADQSNRELRRLLERLYSLAHAFNGSVPGGAHTSSRP